MKKEWQGWMNHEILRALSKIISQELKDPRTGFMTVTRCEVTQDLHTCNVMRFRSAFANRIYGIK